MERKMIITDFGKDFGFGRFSVEARGLKFNDNNYNNIAVIALHFDEPCEDCKVSPEDCPGLDDCNISYGR